MCTVRYEYQCISLPRLGTTACRTNTGEQQARKRTCKQHPSSSPRHNLSTTHHHHHHHQERTNPRFLPLVRLVPTAPPFWGSRVGAAKSKGTNPGSRAWGCVSFFASAFAFCRFVAACVNGRRGGRGNGRIFSPFDRGLGFSDGNFRPTAEGSLHR